MFGFTLHFSRWGAIVTLALSAGSLLFAAPNLIPLATYDQLPSWLQLPRMPLGLDLRGGTHLLYQIDTAQLKKDWLLSLQAEARRALSEERIGHNGVLIAGNQVRVTLKDPAKFGEALTRLKRFAQAISPSLLTGSGGGGLDLDVKGADGFITLEPTQPGIQHRVESAVSRSIEVVRRRIDPAGTTEATIQAEGVDRVLIQVPGLKPDEVKDKVGTTAKLSFQLLDLSMTVEEAETNGVPPDDVLLPDEERSGAKLLVHKEVLVSGDDVADARSGYDSGSSGLASAPFCSS